MMLISTNRQWFQQGNTGKGDGGQDTLYLMRFHSPCQLWGQEDILLLRRVVQVDKDPPKSVMLV
jgi:hypothetical protein